jgi:hypothetical protein
MLGALGNKCVIRSGGHAHRWWWVRIISQNAVAIPTIIGVWLASRSMEHADTVLEANIPVSTSVLDATKSAQTTDAAVNCLTAGHQMEWNNRQLGRGQQNKGSSHSRSKPSAEANMTTRLQITS